MIRMHNSILGKPQTLNTSVDELNKRMNKDEVLINTDDEEIKDITKKQVITVLYKNWKGELDIRHIIPCGTLRWGSTEFHKEEQWLMEVYDLEKSAIRTYAFKDIKYIED